MGMIRRWLGVESPLVIVWMWHAAFDGTWGCRCWHSIWYREWDTARSREWGEYGVERHRYREEYSR
jgi:hypothetical protein